VERVLVTGGLGIIGAFACRALLRASRQPVIYDTGSDTELIADTAADCVIENGDVCDLPRLMGVIAKHQPAAIFHVAGRLGATVERFPWLALNANLLGTATVFEAARLSGIQRVVYPSSRQVYGPVAEKHRHPRYDPVPESHPREPALLYGKLKRAGEDLADHYARLYGLDVIALRFASSIGPVPRAKAGDPGTLSSPVLAMIESAMAQRPFRIDCGADQADDLCYAGEAANGFLAALQSAPRPGAFRAYNIGSGELISLGRMIEVVKELYPSWRGAAGPGLDYRRFGPGFYFMMATDRAQAELGFRPAFDFRKAVIDYAQTVERLQAARAGRA
jgi:UDP-glucose 4-epimerase